ncbi:MAG: VCBS repeat-containing protein, partial [Bacteroidetes bacterium]|nr:VCBS repeat-containing protein [Bacteroidota bacterium]
MRAVINILCITLWLCSGCSPEDKPVITSKNDDQVEPGKKLFTLLTEKETGIDFNNKIVQTPQFNILYYDYYFNGGGVAIGDINNDELPDIYFTSNLLQNRLYLNLGNFKFQDISDKAGVNGWDQAVAHSWSSGVTMIDINSDGLLDIYVCKGGPYESEEAKENLLFINNGDSTFSEKAGEYGINDNGFSTQATFFDYDVDGDVDLYVLNHAVYFSSLNIGQAIDATKDKKELQRISSHLYRNNGDDTFTEVTEEAGLLKYGYGLGVVAADLNNDGWPDLYVANDFSTPDRMFINLKNGTFSDDVNRATSHISYYGMGCDIADINNDGYADIFVLDMTAEDHYRSKTLMASMSPKLFNDLHNIFGYQYQYMFNTLQLNNGNGSFSEIGQLAGLHKTDWSWAPLFADFDNDGLKDLFVTNGIRQDTKDRDHVMAIQKREKEIGRKIPPEEIMGWISRLSSKRLPNYLFHNTGNLRFENKAMEWGIDKPTFSNGAAYGDLDNDGDLDLVINNIDDPAHIYRNNSDQISENNFVRIKLKGSGNDIMGLNTKVTVYAGGIKQFQELTLTKGFQSSSENILHFGLGNAEVIDSVVVRWLNNMKQTFTEVAVNEVIVINRKTATKVASVIKPAKKIISEIPDKRGLNFVHKENVFNDFEKEILLPHKQSIYGPPLEVGDVNNDGLDDVVVGGAMGQAAALYIQQKDGKFTKRSSSAWEQDKDCEDTGIAIFDFDNDGDNDIYIVSGGGGEFEIGSNKLQDRLYINEGNMRFRKSNKILEERYESSL